MKKHIIVLCLILYSFSGTAQNSPPPLINGELNYFIGSHFLVGTTPCPTFNSNNLPNWFRTHGSPNHTAGAVAMFATVYTTGPTLGHAGEGIAANYQFKQGLTYYIDIGISRFDKGTDVSGDATGQIEIYAANGLTQGAAIDCGDPIPNITNKQWIDTYSPSSASTTNDVFKVSFTANTDFSHFWIYPTCGFCDNFTQTIVSLDYVRIYPCAKPSIIRYNDISTPANFIKQGYTSAEFVYTESSSSNLTINDNNDWTWLLGEAVFLNPNTEIIVNNVEGDPWFLATAVESCAEQERVLYKTNAINANNQSVKWPNTYSKAPRDSLRQGGIDNMLLQTEDGISVSPNPASNSLTVAYKMSGSKEVLISINSINGMNLRKQIFKSVPNTMNTFKLDISDLLKGVYLIEIQDADKRVTKRITKL